MFILFSLWDWGHLSSSWSRHGRVYEEAHKPLWSQVWSRCTGGLRSLIKGESDQAICEKWLWNSTPVGLISYSDDVGRKEWGRDSIHRSMGWPPGSALYLQDRLLIIIFLIHQPVSLHTWYAHTSRQWEYHILTYSPLINIYFKTFSPNSVLCSVTPAFDGVMFWCLVKH